MPARKATPPPSPTIHVCIDKGHLSVSADVALDAFGYLVSAMNALVDTALQQHPSLRTQLDCVPGGTPILTHDSTDDSGMGFRLSRSTPTAKNLTTDA